MIVLEYSHGLHKYHSNGGGKHNGARQRDVQSTSMPMDRPALGMRAERLAGTLILSIIFSFSGASSTDKVVIGIDNRVDVTNSAFFLSLCALSLARLAAILQSSLIGKNPKHHR